MMRISYNKLWKILVDKKLTRTALRESVGFSTVILAKLGKNENVNTSTLIRICEYLECDITDIISTVKQP